MPLPWQRTFHQVKKYVLHIYTSRPTSVPTFISNALFSSIFGIMCRYHGNTLSATVRKMCLAHLHPKADICAEFHENRSKTEEVVHDAKFPPIFLPIIYGYHGNTLSATVKNCVLHIYTPRQTSVPNSMRIGQKLRKYM